LAAETTVTGRSLSRITDWVTLPNSALPTGDRSRTPMTMASLSYSSAAARIVSAGSPVAARTVHAIPAGLSELPAAHSMLWIS